MVGVDVGYKRIKSFNDIRGDSIGRLLVLEFNETEMDIFKEVMEVVERHPDFKKYELCTESSLQIPGLEIYLDRREISLTAKEFDILYFLVANCGRVMTYTQIYRHVWGDYVQDIENNTIGDHICNLKEKMFIASPCSSFHIRCERGEVTVWNCSRKGNNKIQCK